MRPDRPSVRDRLTASLAILAGVLALVAAAGWLFGPTAVEPVLMFTGWTVMLPWWE